LKYTKIRILVHWIIFSNEEVHWLLSSMKTGWDQTPKEMVCLRMWKLWVEMGYKEAKEEEIGRRYTDFWLFISFPGIIWLYPSEIYQHWTTGEINYEKSLICIIRKLSTAAADSRFYLQC
jgi:hypothetical protein